MPTESAAARPCIRRLAANPRWRDAAALAVLLAAVLVFYARGLRPGYAYLPVDLAAHNLPWQTAAAAQQPLQNWLISDPLYQFYPFLEHNLQVIRQEHTWPLWDTGIFSGHPSYADPLYQPFYPVFILLGLAFGAARGLTLGLVLHAVLAAWFTYGLLRELAGTRPAAVLGALVYALGGYLVTWFETPFWLATLAWLPAVWWAWSYAVRRRSLAAVGLGGLALGAAALAGQFSFVASFLLFLGIYAAARTTGMLLRRERGWLWPLASLAGIGLLGGLTAAVQILPFSELLNLSRRTLAGGMAFDPLPYKQLITLLLPNIYGNPSLPSAYWGAGNYSEMVIYAGSLALLLALPAVFYPRKSGVRSLLAALAVVVWLSLGLPGSKLLGYLPLLRYISLHRLVFILPLGLAVLAARGLSARLPPRAYLAGALLLALLGAAFMLANRGLFTNSPEVVRNTLVMSALVLAAACILLALRNRTRQPFIADALLILLAFSELYLLGARYNPRGPLANLMPATPAVAVAQQAEQPARIAVLQTGEILYGPNIPGLYGLAEAGGYSSLVLRPYYDLVAAGDPVIDISWASRESNMLLLSHPSERLLDLLNVRFVYARQPLPDPQVVVEGTDKIGAKYNLDRFSYFPMGLSGTFTVTGSALNRIDLTWHKPDPATANYSVIFQLWQGKVAKFIFEQIIKASELADGKVITLYFEPQRDAPGNFYTWAMALAPWPEYEMTKGMTGYPDVQAYGAGWAQAYEGEVYVWEHLSALPRAGVVYAAEQAADNAALTARLLDSAFGLRNTAISTAQPELPAVPPQPATRATIEGYTSTRVVVRAQAASAGLLVLADQYYPGWRATVDGAPVQVLRVNAIQRGVLLGPGEHLVVFSFQPPLLARGLALSALGLLLAAGCVLVGRVRARRNRLD
ncbi:MAG: YfhO family protein [Anaerolineae bacterium]